jgi:hypothetical protein
VLAVLGAAAGAATIVLLRHGTAQGPATLPPATLQIVNAINEPPPGSLPAGWTTFTHRAASAENAGFTIAYPANWTASTSGYQTYLKNPSADEYLLVDLTPHTFRNDMLAEAESIKSRSLELGRFPGYSQIGRLTAFTLRGTRGAYWKFTWLDGGVQQEVIDLLFVQDGQSYALYFTAPASVWAASRPVFDEQAETFAPLT